MSHSNGPYDSAITALETELHDLHGRAMVTKTLLEELRKRAGEPRSGSAANPQNLSNSSSENDPETAEEPPASTCDFQKDDGKPQGPPVTRRKRRGTGDSHAERQRKYRERHREKLLAAKRAARQMARSPKEAEAPSEPDIEDTPMPAVLMPVEPSADLRERYSAKRSGPADSTLNR